MQQHRKSVAMAATLVLALVLVLMGGCSNAPARTSAVPTATSQPCGGLQVPPDVVATDGTDTICPNVVGMKSPKSGYQAFIYHIPQSGVIHIMTRGGGERLVLAAVLYTEQTPDGFRGVLTFLKATAYDVESVPVQCSSKSLDATAQPQYVVVFVPSSDVLHPTEVPGDVQTVGNVTEVATDPIFGLPVTPEIADALCAQPASL